MKRKPTTRTTLEWRAFELAPVSVPDGPPRIEGHAAVFDKLSHDLGGFRELIQPGAFTNTLLSIEDLRAKFNHDDNFILGRLRSGTLELREDDRGLRMIILPPDTTWVRDLLVSMERGDVTGSSFAFRVPDGGDSWRSTDHGMVRTVHEIDLRGGDVSVVSSPAYESTTAAVKRSLWLARRDAAQGANQREANALALCVGG